MPFAEHINIALNSEKFIHELESVPSEIIKYWKSIMPDDHELIISESHDRYGTINFYYTTKLKNMKAGMAYQNYMLGKKVDGHLFILLYVDLEEFRPRYYEVDKAIKLLKLKAFW